MYHLPVMLTECLTGLNIKPGGIYADVTFGGGGHSKAVLAAEKNIRLLGFDQDEAAQRNVPADDRFTLVASNFRHIKKYLRLHGALPLDGLLADLGVSSHQFDEADRGFSFRFDAELDMRMDQSTDLTAARILNEYKEEDLHKLFGMYGEVTNARSLAKAIVSRRAKKAIVTTAQLKELLAELTPKNKQSQYFAQVFQALRIEVNDEMGALKDLLNQCAEIIKPGGRLVVMSYHSLEDKLVKNFIREGKLSGKAEKDLYGNTDQPFEAVSRKAIVPSDEEIAANPRARSAKLRIAERR